jgi:hypothetical protein
MNLFLERLFSQYANAPLVHPHRSASQFAPPLAAPRPLRKAGLHAPTRLAVRGFKISSLKGKAQGRSLPCAPPRGQTTFALRKGRRSVLCLRPAVTLLRRAGTLPREDITGWE